MQSLFFPCMKERDKRGSARRVMLKSILKKRVKIGSVGTRVDCVRLCHISIPVIANLRKKFEEDKKRIAEMKSARKFRPY